MKLQENHFKNITTKISQQTDRQTHLRSKYVLAVA